jgi:hypothetical protein
MKLLNDLDILPFAFIVAIHLSKNGLYYFRRAMPYAIDVRLSAYCHELNTKYLKQSF